MPSSWSLLPLPTLTSSSSAGALLEVDLPEKENRLVLRDRGAAVVIRKKGVYALDAGQALLAVYDGKATVQLDDRVADVGKGRAVTLEPAARLEPQRFDRDQTDELQNWSKLRSEILAQASAASVQMVVSGNPSWWAGTGWYLNPWYSSLAFIPGSGLHGNPCGFGFYSRGYWAYNPPVSYWTGRPVRGGGHFVAPRIGGGARVGGSPRFAAARSGGRC